MTTKPIQSIKLSAAQRRWLVDKLQNKKVDPKKQAAVERREQRGASHVTIR